MNARQPCDDFRLLSSNPLVRLDGGDADLSFKVGKRHLNGAGTLHGGVLASVFDSALGECVYRQAQHSGRPASLVVTTQLDIHYCAPAHVGERVAVAVEVLRLGGRLAVATARASVAERLVGTATGSFYLTR
ncbi:PaaI family thioesterase [Azonexus sp.]|uniref:PaaI family thioesterase n=1 Tax=Azonexus sp. TaxID=1872668 RepID=UPI0035B2B7B2